ncbi:5967_t:CDS:2, partial [Scutellospora calospora]
MNEYISKFISEEEFLKDPSIIYGQLYYSSEKPTPTPDRIKDQSQEHIENVLEVQQNNKKDNKAKSQSKEIQSTDRCIMCGSESHSSNMCEKTTHPNNDQATWRRYKYQQNVVPQPITYISCFNCSSRNHGGRIIPVIKLTDAHGMIPQNLSPQNLCIKILDYINTIN